MTNTCCCHPGSVPIPNHPQVAEVLARYSAGHREYLIPILQETQEKMAYLSRDAMIQIAAHVGVPVSKVYGVVTFYNQFRLTAPGEHTILVCRGTACHVRGSDQVLRSFESELGIKAGDTTKDGKVTLDIVACLGSCSIAPVITIDGVFHGRVGPKDCERLVRELRQGVKQ
jgi:NADH-quinone oxidoreductase subunit E